MPWLTMSLESSTVPHAGARCRVELRLGRLASVAMSSPAGPDTEEVLLWVAADHDPGDTVDQRAT